MDIIETQEQKEKRLKRTEPKRFVGHHQVDQHMYHEGPRKIKGQREYLKQLWLKLTSFDERQEYKHPRANILQDELKETHTDTHYNQNFKRQNLESRKKEMNYYIQVALSKNLDFLSQTLGQEDNRKTYSVC